MRNGARSRPQLLIRTERVGGDISLDFVNTVTWDVDGLSSERLLRYRDLVRWAREAGLLSGEQSAVLLEAGERRSDAAQLELDRAMRARQLIREVFHGHVGPAGAPSDALDALSVEIAHALGSARIVQRPGAFIRVWAAEPDDLGQVIRPILASAAELLLGERVHRVRECANPHCSWLFLDESRNGMRRWCDMRVCGNRLKARRHYARRVGR